MKSERKEKSSEIPSLTDNIIKNQSIFLWHKAWCLTLTVSPPPASSDKADESNIDIVQT